MKITCRDERGQDGSVIVIVMIVLALLTIIGISSTNMSSTEQKIAGNDKNYKIAFYHAESGPNGMAKLVSRIIDNTEETPKEAEEFGADEEGRHRFEFLDPTATDLLDEVVYDDEADSELDVEFTMTSGVADGSGLIKSTRSEVTVNIFRKKTDLSRGGGAEFGTGASGVGEKTAFEVPVWLNAEAVTDAGARATISAMYLKLYGIPGGL